MSESFVRLDWASELMNPSNMQHYKSLRDVINYYNRLWC